MIAMDTDIENRNEIPVWRTAPCQRSGDAVFSLIMASF